MHNYIYIRNIAEKWTPFNVSVTARNSVGSSKPVMQVIFTEEGGLFVV